MHTPPPDLFARARERRQHLQHLLEQVNQARAELSDEINNLIGTHGLSERAVAAGVGYRSSTSIRRARARHQQTTDHD